MNIYDLGYSKNIIRYEPLENIETKNTFDTSSFSSLQENSRVEISPDDTIGIRIKDDADNEVFKAMVGGIDVGDVIIGDYSNGQGLKYDKSENTTTFAGALSAATGTLGSITIAEDGYIKSGQTAYDTGKGFWLGDDSGITKFSLGDDSGNHLKWDGDKLEMLGNAIITSDKVYHKFAFESVPQYGVIEYGAGTHADFYSGQLRILMSDTANAYAYYKTNREYPRIQGTLNPYMQATLSYGLEEDLAVFHIGFPGGINLPHVTRDGFYGFRIEPGTGEGVLRVYYMKNGTITYNTKTGINVNNRHVYAVKTSDNGAKIEYIVDGTIIHTETDHDIHPSSPYAIIIGAYADSTTPTEFSCNFSEVIFYYDYE
jgi:hypothetical protein